MLVEVEGSSFSDQEDQQRRQRGSSDGLNTRDSESESNWILSEPSWHTTRYQLEYSSNPNQVVAQRLIKSQGQSSSYQGSSYYNEYLSLPKGPNPFSAFNNPSPPNNFLITDTPMPMARTPPLDHRMRIKSYNEDICDTSEQNCSEPSWVDLVASEKQSASEVGKAFRNFENVSNAAFINCPKPVGDHQVNMMDSSEPSSVNTSSPTNQDNQERESFDTPTLSFNAPTSANKSAAKAKESASLNSQKDSSSQSEVLLDILVDSFSATAAAENSKPSYKDVLEMPIKSSSKPFDSQKLRKAHVQAQQQQKFHPKQRGSEQSKSQKSSTMSSSSLANSVDALKKSPPLEIPLKSHSPRPSSANNHRCPASSDDIIKVISKSLESRGADRSGSDLSNISAAGLKVSSNLECNELRAQYPTFQQLPPSSVPYSQWAHEFRMPREFSPREGSNVFNFPYNDRSDPNVLKQVKDFRKSLTMYEGKLISRCDFDDYEPELNYFYKANSTPGKQGKKLYTDSGPIKVFNMPPMRMWIPVRCDALDMDLKFERAVEGHAGKAGGKAQVSIVYNAKNLARKELYIRKEYSDLEYFTNEYNFLQFAHHPHIPKPYCVEYDQYPKIVMEYVEGERVHMSFYILGKALLSKYPTDARKRWDHMAMVLGRVLGKILVTIKYIHSIGFIHADLKPENIIYNLTTGRITIIDFDLSVSAPYAFTGRGTEATIAPEINGLLKGPVHFGIDWWAYGSTAAMIIAVAMAGIQPGTNEIENDKLIQYIPFKYHRATNQYEMTPIPESFPPVMRSFLYPFFNPDPSKRVFSEAKAYNWIRGHPMFSCIEDWKKYENLDLGPFAALTPIQIGFKIFSKKPFLLQPVNRISKFINGISNMLNFGNVFPLSVKVSDSVSERSSDSSSSSDDDEDESEDNTSNDRIEIFKFDDDNEKEN